jgi:hypothetical protein
METSSETTETSEHTSHETVETLQKSYLFNGQFFSIVHCGGIKLVAQCKNCSKVILLNKSFIIVSTLKIRLDL